MLYSRLENEYLFEINENSSAKSQWLSQEGLPITTFSTLYSLIHKINTINALKCYRHILQHDESPIEYIEKGEQNKTDPFR